MSCPLFFLAVFAPLLSAQLGRLASREGASHLVCPRVDDALGISFPQENQDGYLCFKDSTGSTAADISHSVTAVQSLEHKVHALFETVQDVRRCIR